MATSRLKERFDESVEEASNTIDAARLVRFAKKHLRGQVPAAEQRVSQIAAAKQAAALEQEVRESVSRPPASVKSPEYRRVVELRDKVEDTPELALLCEEWAVRSEILESQDRTRLATLQSVAETRGWAAVQAGIEARLASLDERDKLRKSLANVDTAAAARLIGSRASTAGFPDLHADALKLAAAMEEHEVEEDSNRQGFAFAILFGVVVIVIAVGLLLK